jgi:heme/copper-type cytochrome/quinol oxidase subunit 2
MLIWYGFTSIVLGLVLTWQVRKFMIAISINKFQRKNNRAITEEEKQKIQKKVTLFAIIISMTFAFLFNRFIMFKSFGVLK